MKRLFLTLLLVSGFVQAFSCTSFLVGKKASKDGSTMITYAADSHVRYGELYFRKGGNWGPNDKVKLYDRGSMKFLGEIPQAPKTYNVIGFMNENQVSIGETTFGGRNELEDTTAMMDYGSLMFVAMDRARTAREAIKVIAELVEEYGYYSSGESFSIADPNEVWIMEIIGKGTEMVFDKKSQKMVNKNKGAVWVAIRIPDDCISAHANHARITNFKLEDKKTSISSKNLKLIDKPEIEVVYAHDVIEFAKQKGYFEGKNEDFSFSDSYAPIDFEAARFCEARVWSFFRRYSSDMDKYLEYAKGYDLKNRMPLYIKPDKLLGVEDLIDGKRDHYEGTYFDMTKDVGALPHYLPYRWRPMTWKHNGKNYLHERATATQQTGFSYVTQMRSKYPNHIGGIIWFSVDDAASTVYVPFYCGIDKIPHQYAVGNGDMLTYSRDAAFWVFNKVANYAYLRYDLMSKDIIAKQKELEEKHFKIIKEYDNKALYMFNNNLDKLRVLQNSLAEELAKETVEAWQELFEYLLVKYIDGNVKREDENGFKRNEHGFPVSPMWIDYPDKWKDFILEDTGDKFLVPEEG